MHGHGNLAVICSLVVFVLVKGTAYLQASVVLITLLLESSVNRVLMVQQLGM